ncbi:unnamed protein product [Protopolystoma xenopodis]|uniref:Ig-like domain-containing protein n=1 Tax=Protopolystoma xenopodis TaxID=117903 RepID=A0A448WRS9_9PLAT|nr:unnamed protein product [Protopolystoma xenopodis]
MHAIAGIDVDNSRLLVFAKSKRDVLVRVKANFGHLLPDPRDWKGWNAIPASFCISPEHSDYENQELISLEIEAKPRSLLQGSTMRAPHGDAFSGRRIDVKAGVTNSPGHSSSPDRPLVTDTSLNFNHSSSGEDWMSPAYIELAGKPKTSEHRKSDFDSTQSGLGCKGSANEDVVNSIMTSIISSSRSSSRNKHLAAHESRKGGQKGQMKQSRSHLGGSRAPASLLEFSQPLEDVCLRVDPVRDPGRLELVCRLARPEPAAVVRWLFNGQPRLPLHLPVTKFDAQTARLTATDLRPEMSGWYSVEVSTPIALGGSRQRGQSASGLSGGSRRLESEAGAEACRAITECRVQIEDISGAGASLELGVCAST